MPIETSGNGKVTSKKIKTSNTPQNGNALIYNDGDLQWTAVSGVGGTDVKDVKVSNSDTTPSYLQSKIVGTTNNITVTKQNSGTNESLKIDIGSSVLTNNIIDTDDAFIANSDSKISSQKATKTYIDNKFGSISTNNLNTSNFASGIIDTNLTDVSANDDTIPSAKAVKTYVDSSVSTISVNNLNISNFTSGVVDTDETLASNSDVKLATQKAVKTYVDTHSGAGGSISDNSLTYDKSKNPFARIQTKNTILFSYQANTITLNSDLYIIDEADTKLISLKASFVSMDISSYNFPSSSSFYALYVDRSDSNKLKIGVYNTISTKNYILAYIYKTTVIGNEIGIQVIDVNGNEVVQKSNNVNYYAFVDARYANQIEIDTTAKTVKVNADMYLTIDDKTYRVYPQTATSYTDTGATYLKICYYDMVTGKIAIKELGTTLGINNRHALLFYFNNSNFVTHYAKNTEIIYNGTARLNADIISNNSIKTLMNKNPNVLMPYKDTITINFKTSQVVLNKDLYIIGDNDKQKLVNYSGFTPIDISSYDLLNVANYNLYSLYIEASTATLKFALTSSITVANYTLAYVFMGKVIGDNEGINVLDTNGLPSYQLKKPLSSVMDWTTNRLVLPSKLYLVKDMQYSIHAYNMNYYKLDNYNDTLFEIVMPTYSEQFNKTCKIVSQITTTSSIPFKTQIVERYLTSGVTTGLAKDIDIIVSDKTGKTQTTPKIMMIGDSITAANMPYLTKWWLTQWGVNPTMIGTQGNQDLTFGYYAQNLTTTLGEGRGGWKLSDFVGAGDKGNVPWTTGQNTLSTNPFLNPSTSQFDFSNYMTAQGFSGVDFVTIALGTNDLFIFDSNSITNMKTWLNTMITSIQTYNSNIKIGIIPPPMAGAGNPSFNQTQAQWAEEEIAYCEAKTNVYVIGSYLSTGSNAGKCLTASGQYPYTAYSSVNNTRIQSVSRDVHDAGNNQYSSALWNASWIMNMLT